MRVESGMDGETRVTANSASCRADAVNGNSHGIMPSAPSAAAVETVRRSQTASPSPLARNPVSLRLYKVLGATFEDEATREALSTLSDLYTPSGSTVIVSSAKEDSIVLDGVDDVDLESIKNVPNFLRGAPPGDTAAKARKHLRRDIESKMEEGSLRFLAAFSVVDQVRITFRTRTRFTNLSRNWIPYKPT
jgi:conserved oligomeric Golgi complex subunit 6